MAGRGRRALKLDATFLVLDTRSSSRASLGLCDGRRVLELGVLRPRREPPLLPFEPARACAVLAKLQVNPRGDFAEPPRLRLAPPSDRRAPPRFRRAPRSPLRLPPDDCLWTPDAFAQPPRALVEPPPLRSRDAPVRRSASLPLLQADRARRCAALPDHGAAPAFRCASPLVPRAAHCQDSGGSPKRRRAALDSRVRSTRAESGATRSSRRPSPSSRLPSPSRRRSAS